MNYPTTEQVSAQLEQYARTIAPTVAFLITLAVHTYWLGHRFGQLLHQTNDWLAAHWPTRPTTPAPATTAEPSQNVTLADVIAATGATVTVDRTARQTAEALALRAQGLSQRAIAERMGVSRTTVRRRLASAV